MKKLMVATVLVASMAGFAQAADMLVKAPPAPVYNWTGWYVGINGGGAWSSSESDTFSGAGPLAPFFFGGNEFPTALSSSSKGAFGGLQTGYNWQLSPSWLVGVETDIQLSNYAGTAIATPTPTVPVFPFTTQVSQQSTWFGTLRARLGWLATQTLLVYGTGGLAYGQTETSFSTIPVGFNLGTCPANFTCATGTGSSNKSGWAAGGGLEWMFAPHWTLRAEYLYLDLGSQSVSAAPFTPFGALAVNSFTATSTFHENIARAAINFGF
jgi:outer membrane immunogenic protein